MQLSFAVIPLVQFTNDKRKMGAFVNNGVARAAGWCLAVLIAGLNVYLVVVTVMGGGG